MSTAPVTPRMIRCPGCGGPSLYSSANAHRPFCSPRCKNLDFGAWASERYGVAAEEPEDPAMDGDAASPPTRQLSARARRR